jgi:hypothetical protein
MVKKLLVYLGQFILRKLFNLTVEIVNGRAFWTFRCNNCGTVKSGFNRYKVWKARHIHHCEWNQP